METLGFDPVCERPTGLQWPIKVGRKSTSPTWKVANGPSYVRLGGGWYVARARPDCPEQRIVEASARIGPDQSRGCITGWAGLRWHGASYFDGGGRHGGDQLPVEVNFQIVTVRPAPGVIVTQRGLAPSERVLLDGLPVATVQRCLFDEIRRRDDLWDAVTAIDMAAAAGLISVWQFATYVGESNSWTGAPLAREAVALAVDESLSPREPWLRLCWVVVAGLPQPLVNRPVFSTDGTFLGMPDLFDPTSGTAVEYQGPHHLALSQHRDDVKRSDLLRDHGVEVVEVVRGETRAQVADRVTRGRERALETPASRRRWTVVPPPGWPQVLTLDEHLESLGRAEHLMRH